MCCGHVLWTGVGRTGFAWASFASAAGGPFPTPEMQRDSSDDGTHKRQDS
jgi:hypothetical protein